MTGQVIAFLAATSARVVDVTRRDCAARSSKRSAATRGSQYRLGKLARTESAASSTASGT